MDNSQMETTHLDSPLELTDAERAKINARAQKELVQVVLVQALMGTIVALVAGLIAGQAAALSALAGAGAYFVPNLLFALRLIVSMHSPKASNPLVFLVGEMLKIAAAVVLLWLIHRLGGNNVVWLAVFAGLVGVVKAYLLMMILGGFRPVVIAK